MLKYLNGKIVASAIPNETALLIKTVGDNVNFGQPLAPVFQEILKEYAKHITAICFLGGEENQQELIDLVKQVKKAGLKACVSTYYDNETKILQNLSKELDYLYLKNKLYKKDYSPFGDAEVWIDA